MALAIKTPGWVEEFRAFIMRGSVVDLAVGIIIGAAFTSIVGSLVKDIFNPLLGLLIGGVDFSDVFITLRGPHTDTLDAAKAAGAVTMNVGVFINAVIQFLIVAFAVFWMVRGLSRLTRRKPVVETAPIPTADQLLLTEIRDLLAHDRPAHNQIALPIG